jgi:hypothetical protein
MPPLPCVSGLRATATLGQESWAAGSIMELTG